MSARRILIAGAPGSGKSTVGAALARQGYITIDTDAYPRLSNWVSRTTGKKDLPPPQGMSKSWLAGHDYNWDVSVLEEIMEAVDDDVIFFGSSSNQEQLLHLFDVVFLLKIEPLTLMGRLKKRSKNSDDEFGKTDDERAHVLTWYEDFQDRYARKRAIVLNATDSVNRLVAQISDKLS